MDIQRRKEELDKKRQKLAELRRAREERRASIPVQSTPSDSLTTTISTRRPDLEALVSSLLDQSTLPTSSHPSRDQVLPSSSSHSSLSSSPVPTSSHQSPFIVNEPTHCPSSFRDDQESASPFKLNVSLQPSDIVLFDFLPLERVLYSKELQTDDSLTSSSFMNEIDSVPESNAAPSHSNDNDNNSTEVNADNETKVDRSKTTDPKLDSHATFTNEELNALLTSESFVQFFNSSSRTIEKALSITEKFDFLRDYTINSDVIGNDSEMLPVRLNSTFYHDHLSSGRTVSSISWNTRFPELFAVAYTRSSLPTMESDGLILIWNLLMPTQPEFVLTCQSEVCTTQFSDFHPHLVVGGTYSGQVSLWDTRTKSCSPILKTPLSAAGHTHPVTCCGFVGTEHAHQLLTSSTDGTLCSWHLDVFAQPQEILQLNIPPALALASRDANGIRPSLTHFPSSVSTPGDVGLTCFSFPPNEAFSLWIGTEHGSVYHVSRYDRATTKAGVVDLYSGHTAPVTSITFHPDNAGLFGNIFLTTSMDWTVKLWRTRKVLPSTSTSVTSSATASTTDATSLNSSTQPHVLPIFSFLEIGDYVFDVAWSPIHPAVFATVDGCGHLDVWDLNRDTELYITRIRASHRALNKVFFSKDGRHVAVGGADGHVYQYDLADQFLPQNEDDEVIRFQSVLDEMEAIENERRSLNGSNSI